MTQSRSRFSWFWLPLVCGVGILTLTILSLVSHVAWYPYLELLAHFKVQYLLGTLLLLIGVGWQRDRRWLWVALVCLGLQLSDLMPWFLSQSWHPSPSSPESPSLRILTANLYYRNQNPHALLDLIERESPDMVVVQEKTAQWMSQLAPIQSTFPYLEQALDDLAIFSRIPIRDRTIFGTRNHSTLAVTLMLENTPLVVVAAHPPPPKPRLIAQRNLEFDWITEFVQAQRSPLVLVGDLNTTMWSPYYQRLERQTGLRNARRGFGILPTWPAPTPFSPIPIAVRWLKHLLWIPIDHVLVSPELQVRSLRTGDNIDSDHLPLIADVRVPIMRKADGARVVP